MKINFKSVSFINLILYDLLLIITPFLLIRNYLQITLKEISHFKIDLFLVELPIFVLIFILFGIFAIIFFLKNIRLKQLYIIFSLIFLMFIGQNIADFYLNYSYYDLQNNWHYFAYGIFVFVAFRYFRDKIQDDSKLIKLIFFKAFIISSIDEGIQVFISNRIFDISDIAKDMWGVCLGLIILLFWVKNYNLKDFNLIIKSPLKYFKEPVNVLFEILIFTLIFLFFSSILTNSSYFIWIIIWSLSTFIVVLLFQYLNQFKIIKYLTIIFIIIFFGFIALNLFSKHTNVISKTNSIIYFKNLPLFFFDYMIYPNGMIRMVDKKNGFRGNDFIIFKKQNPEVLIISSDKGPYDITGFEHSNFVEFPYVIFNDIYKNIFQVLILKQDDAIKQYNRLIKEKKKVLLVLHQSL